ncbi:Gfo/Idh/MocA family oxidoreductase [Paenibacillus sp.]|uniref:Gfo/Idh/MocA family protein n=1 Tax=Paenibacillus sp. TaxID=58172 RepID=UPI002D5074A7|nr:Gfo/Idh/MocA family oxidoreductase [Paenibacillus sp.]HZG55925.1 Gfo/Idh/MocA family oxidoreductase [Paenibacillus sp.]
MGELRVCMIGAGQLSTRRIYPYIGAAGARLVAACDLDEERAVRNTRLFGGKPYTNYVEMLEAERPDAVIVCIGPQQHYELAIDMMKRGYPVYTEKPPAPTAAQALEMARVSKETGRLCSIAFKKRYNVANNRAKEWIAKFDPSDLYSISADYCSAQYSNDSLRRDFLHDFTIHMIDLVSYLFGDASEVFCFSKGKDAYAVSVKFANGAVGSLNFNCGRTFALPTEEVEITIRGGNFMTIHNSSAWRISENERGVEWREPPTFISAGDSGNETGHLAELVDFFQAVREGRTTRSNVYESYKSVVLYEAIRDSAATGRVVKVQYEAL